MPALPHCPQCQSEYTYEDGEMYVCPECGHEWLKKEWSKQAEADNNDEGFVIRDVNGAVLKNGDSVTVIKDLKIKGSSSVIKVGTKIKNIRLLDKPDHNIDCRVSGVGAALVTAAFVKKA